MCTPLVITLHVSCSSSQNPKHCFFVTVKISVYDAFSYVPIRPVWEGGACCSQLVRIQKCGYASPSEKGLNILRTLSSKQVTLGNVTNGWQMFFFSVFRIFIIVKKNRRIKIKTKKEEKKRLCYFFLFKEERWSLPAPTVWAGCDVGVWIGVESLWNTMICCVFPSKVA